MKKSSLQHIAFILDGNRRWARKRGLPPYLGHQQGARTLEKLIEASSELTIPYLTFWGGSVANLTQRSRQEIKKLWEVYEEYFAKLLTKKELQEKDIRIRVLGNWQRYLPKKLQAIFSALNENTKKHRTYHLTFLIAYDGKEEMKEAITRIKKQEIKGRITENLIKQNLWTGELPEVDLVIRTGVENDPHWSSGFMMWHCANSQFYFTETLWPDFTKEELQEAIRDFQRRERRLGR